MPWLRRLTTRRARRALSMDGDPGRLAQRSQRQERQGHGSHRTTFELHGGGTGEANRISSAAPLCTSRPGARLAPRVLPFLTSTPSFGAQALWACEGLAGGSTAHAADKEQGAGCHKAWSRSRHPPQTHTHTLQRITFTYKSAHVFHIVLICFTEHERKPLASTA